MTRIGSVCSGYEGLGMAVQAVLGGELAFVADIDPGASAILAHRFPSVPNYADITAADWTEAGPVDILAAGFPCQPVSLAGKQLGEADERWIWPSVVRVVRDLRPGLVFLENVSALVVRGLAGIAADLAKIGYVGSWRCVRASDVGACHRRERVFILAWPTADARGRELQRRGVAGVLGGTPPAESCEGHQRERAGNATGDSGAATPEDSDRAAVGERRLTAPRQAPGGWPRADSGGSGGMRAAADPERGGRDRRTPLQVRGQAERASTTGGSRGADIAWGPFELAIRRHERAFGRPAPRPTEPGRTGERLSPRFVEWMMGLPEGWVTDVPGLSRNAQLKALGNGVVPAQAALALRMLLERAEAAPLVTARGAA